MLATLVLERNLLTVDDLPAAVLQWAQAAGGLAILVLLLWAVGQVLAFTSGRRRAGGTPGPAGEVSVVAAARQHLARLIDEQSARFGWSWRSPAFAVVASLALGSWAAALAVKSIEPPPPAPEAPATSGSNWEPPPLKPAAVMPATTGDWLLAVSGLFAVAAVALPLLRDLGKFSPRRVFALALLSYQEAVRRKVLWVFGFFFLLFLFMGWFVDAKPEDQLRTYVTIIYSWMTILLLFTAGLLASFSIPADIKTQTIHTIVTKPVEKFEIVLGRFLGYAGLMSLVLVGMTALSVVYVIRGVNPEAAYESLRARVPVFATDLEVWDEKGKSRGVSVGREWEYRSYIVGARDPKQSAQWVFRDLPRSLAARGTRTPCEFSLDIFRTRKSDVENKGVFVRFTVESWRADPSTRDSREIEQGDPEAVARRYGIYKTPSLEIKDYHTQEVRDALAKGIPAGVFENQLASSADLDARASVLRANQQAGTITPDETAELADLERDIPRLREFEKTGKRPPLRVIARCESDAQYLGVARLDLYLLDHEGSAVVNFFKGALGVWFRVCLVTGVGVACSTYLSGVISLLSTFFLFGLGVQLEFVSRVALNKEQGGGPMEAFIRLVNRDTPAAPLDMTPTVRAANLFDEGFRWALHRLLNVIPDVNRFDLTKYLSDGFDIPVLQLFTDSFLPLAGYLIPWAILSYYLMKSREVATS